ncbi:MAG: response regulator [Sphingorhabdus sp.]
MGIEDTKNVKIAIVDDHQLFLTGLALVIQDMEGRFEVTTFEAPLELLDAIQRGEVFDLVLCDLIMNTMNGLAFIAALRSASSIPVLMLSGINTAPPIEEMRALGAQGFVHKSIDNDGLSNAIQTILYGNDYFANPQLDDAKPHSAVYGDTERHEYSDTDTVPILTVRQLEVLQLISGGASNSEIATQLSISPNTVKSHLKQLFDVLQVNKRTACVRAAQNYGLI